MSEIMWLFNNGDAVDLTWSVLGVGLQSCVQLGLVSGRKDAAMNKIREGRVWGWAGCFLDNVGALTSP